MARDDYDGAPRSRRSLLAATGVLAGTALAGCTGFLPGGGSVCGTLRQKYRLLDEGDFEGAADLVVPHDRDPSSSLSQYAGLLELRAATYGLPEASLEGVECTCVEEQSPDAVRRKFADSGLYGFPFSGELSAVRFVRYQVTVSGGGSGTGLTMLFRLDGDGWFELPVGAVARAFAEECG